MIYFHEKPEPQQRGIACGPFIDGARDCHNYRQLRRRYEGPSIEQLRYVLGYLTYQHSDTDRCALPVKHFKRRNQRRK